MLQLLNPLPALAALWNRRGPADDLLDLVRSDLIWRTDELRLAASYSPTFDRDLLALHDAGKVQLFGDCDPTAAGPDVLRDGANVYSCVMGVQS